MSIGKSPNSKGKISIPPVVCTSCKRTSAHDEEAPFETVDAAYAGTTNEKLIRIGTHIPQQTRRSDRTK